MTARTQPEPLSRRRSLWPWFIVLAVILFVGFVRIRLLNMPLERDEGEYAYAGQLMLQGIPPYHLAYNMKLPGTYGAYAVIMAVFGQTIRGIHLGLIIVNTACIILMFLLGRRWFDPVVGVVAAATYGMVSLSPAVLGLAAHATHFVVLCLLGGMLCLQKAVSSGRRLSFLTGGCLLGLAFVMKQHGLFFGIFGGVWVIGSGLKSRPPDWRRLAGQASWYGAGCALPFGLTCLVLWHAGVFSTFWYWTFVYAQKYVTAISLADGAVLFERQFSRFAGPHWPLALLAAGGIVLLWWKRPARGHALLLTIFLLFSAAAVCPGLYFRQHYFLLLLPAFSLWVGVAASLARSSLAATRLPRWTHCAPAALTVAALVFAAGSQRKTFFIRTPEEVCRSIYGQNPFFESIEIARYIREHTPENARIMVIGSEPQIYFYSHRHSASGFIYTYDLVNNTPAALEMQKRLIQEVEAAEPEFFVLVDVPGTGLPNAGSPRLMFDWGAQYCRNNYVMVGAFDLISPQETDFVWGDTAARYAFKSPFRVMVLARKPGA